MCAGVYMCVHLSVVCVYTYEPLCAAYMCAHMCNCVPTTGVCVCPCVVCMTALPPI